MWTRCPHDCQLEAGDTILIILIHRLYREYIMSKNNYLKLWIFRLTALIILPLLFFILLELLLRIAGYGYNPHFFIKREINGNTFYTENRKYTYKFFTPKLSRAPSYFNITADKDKNTYRVFVIGSSAAQGDPEPVFGISRFIEIMLKDKYPDVNFEVVNAAITAINSHVVYQIAKECAEYKPDLFVIYTGNNEVVGPYGAGTVFSSISPNLSFIRLNIFLKQLRVGQLARNIIMNINPSKDLPSEWIGMEMFLKKQVSADDPKMRLVYNHFQQNVADIIKFADKSGADVVLSTVGTNLKNCPPFASIHNKSLTDKELKEWEKIYQEGITFEENKQHQQAINKYLEADKIDSKYADLHFRIGRCYYEIKDYTSAKDHFIKARDLDTLRFRADSEINKITNDIASQHKTDKFSFIDGMNIFEENSKNSITDDGLFVDHVHLNFKGNYLLAKEIVNTVSSKLPDWVARHSDKEKELLTEAECEKALAYTQFEQYTIYNTMLERKKLPPFSNQLYHEKEIKDSEILLAMLSSYSSPEIIKQGKEIYLQAIKNNWLDDSLHFRYASYLMQVENDYENALKEFQIVNQLLDKRSQAILTNLGMAEINLNNTEQAIKYFEDALDIEPSFEKASFELGNIYTQNKQFNKAIKTFRNLLKADHYNAAAYVNLANTMILENENNYKKAYKYYKKAIKLNPKYAPAYFSYASILERNGEIGKAVENYEKTVSLDPDYMTAYCNLAAIYITDNKYDEAIRVLTQIVRLNPNNPEIYHQLANMYYLKQDYKNAINNYREALKLNPNFPSVQSKLATILATSKVAEFRNGKEALELAQKSCELTNNNDPAFLDTLAMAYAEVGQFDIAIKTSELAINVANETNNSEIIKDIKNHIENYKNNQPIRN